VKRIFNLALPIKAWADEEGIADEEIRERIEQAVAKKMTEKASTYGAELWKIAEKSMLLQILDQTWKDHLLALDHLRQGIGLRAYGQRDPLNEYKREAFEMFDALLANLRERVTMVLAHLELKFEGERPAAPAPRPQPMVESRQDPALVGVVPGAQKEPAIMAAPGLSQAAAALRGVPSGSAAQSRPVVRRDDPRTWANTPRNADCPCGSGKKYKHCHGKIG
jgi:preprotein translocase subunit SecA